MALVEVILYRYIYLCIKRVYLGNTLGITSSEEQTLIDDDIKTCVNGIVLLLHFGGILKLKRNTLLRRTTVACKVCNRHFNNDRRIIRCLMDFTLGFEIEII